MLHSFLATSFLGGGGWGGGMEGGRFNLCFVSSRLGFKSRMVPLKLKVNNERATSKCFAEIFENFEK